MNKTIVLRKIFKLALRGVYHNKESELHIHGEYDPGKYRWHLEEIEEDIYGLYFQTEDSPFGDTWEAWIIKNSQGEFKILDHKVSSLRMYHSEFFKRWLGEIPYRKIKD